VGSHLKLLTAGLVLVWSFDDRVRVLVRREWCRTRQAQVQP
jgi:hypothetical protein